MSIHNIQTSISAMKDEKENILQNMSLSPKKRKRKSTGIKDKKSSLVSHPVILNVNGN